MSDPFDFFERIYCINLDSRPERWHAVSRELARLGIIERVERVPAVTGLGGRNGCHASHLECVRRAQAAGVEAMLIFEDDVVLVDDPRVPLRAALDELRTVGDWEAFYLGGQLIARPGLRLQRIFCAPMVQTHAIALHRRAFSRVLASEPAIDVWYAKSLVSYGMHPPIAYQVTGESDISAGVQDRREALDRSHRVFLLASNVTFPLWRAAYRMRRRAGRRLKRAAARLGVELSFRGLRPKLKRAVRTRR